MKKVRKFLGITAWLAAIMLLACACSSDLDINQVYAYDLVCMPVQKKIVQGKTAEIRCRLVKEGDYAQAQFFIRYFQPDGKGELCLNEGAPLRPNDRYPLEQETFRLYYTSQCTDQQTVDIFIEDSFGQVVQKAFSFQNEKGEEEQPVSIRFDFSTLPVQKAIQNGEEAEIRCTVKKEDERNDARYSIRYFQAAGKGELRLDGLRLKPNDLYELKSGKFNLHYVSACDEKQSVEVFIEDNLGQVVSKKFDFDPIVPEPEPEIDLSFEFSTLPVQKSIAEGERAEIRCQIKKTDPRNPTGYRIRYFQPEGKGELRMSENGTRLLPNDLYRLYDDSFRLYYTSRSTEQQSIDLYIEDDNGNIRQKSFTFTPEATEKP